MKMWIILIIALSGFVASPVCANPGLELPDLVVTDTAGKPIPKAKATAIKNHALEEFLGIWAHANSAGRIQFNTDAYNGEWRGDDPRGHYEVLVCAPGKTPMTIEANVPSAQSPIPVTLHDGREMVIEILPPAGSALPKDLKPILTEASRSERTWASLDPHNNSNRSSQPLVLYEITHKTGNEYSARISDDRKTTDMVLIINHPGFLEDFIKLIPADKIAGNRVEVQLPRPGAIHVDYKTAESTSSEHVKMPNLRAEIWAGQNSIRTTGTRSISKTFDHLAPGNYGIHFIAFPEDADPNHMENWYPLLQTSYYQEGNGPVKVESDKTTTVSHVFHPFDLKTLQGHRNVTIHLQSAIGRKIAGLPWKLTTVETIPDFNQIPVDKGTVPQDQTLRIKNMPDHDFDYLLRVGNNDVFSYLIERKPGDVETTRSITPMRGDVAPDLNLVDIATSRPIHLRDFKGKLLVLDFWATWCDPCQESIGNLELLAKAHPEWRQSVNFVTVSIDEKPEAVQPHLDKKGWGHAGIHYTWFGPGEPSARGGPYGASGVPTTVIIGADGKIVDARWYSSEPKMEQHIEELLKKQPR